jgi:hypothetical protein
MAERFAEPNRRWYLTVYPKDEPKEILVRPAAGMGLARPGFVIRVRCSTLGGLETERRASAGALPSVADIIVRSVCIAKAEAVDDRFCIAGSGAVPAMVLATVALIQKRPPAACRDVPQADGVSPASLVSLIPWRSACRAPL